MTTLYTTKGSAKAAVKVNGLHLMTYEIINKDGYFYAHFMCADILDVQELHSRGFSAEVNVELAAD